MEGKLAKIEEKLSKAVRGKAPMYKTKDGQGYTSGNQADSVLNDTRTKKMNEYTTIDQLPEDERLEPLELTKKLQERRDLEDRIKQHMRNNKHSYGPDVDKLYLGGRNITGAQTGNEISLVRQSFFRNINQYNVVSQKGRPISKLEQSMLYS